MSNAKFRRAIVLALVFFLFAGGTVFTEESDEEISLPHNTVVIDVAPLIGGQFMRLLYLDTDRTIIYGFGVHYERQLTKNSSVSGRFAYGRMAFFDYNHYGDNDYYQDMSSFSGEGHYRYYTANDTFFLDGMLGYSNFIYDSSYEERTIIHYVILGPKVGWRIDFGKPGGFVLEPAVGYYLAIGKNKNFYNDDILSKLANVMNNMMAKGILAGGMRVSLGLGYRF
jgi:hypothetical protein